MKTARLEIRLPETLKRQFLHLCKQDNQTPSKKLRVLISNIVMGSGNINGSYKEK